MDSLSTFLPKNLFSELKEALLDNLVQEQVSSPSDNQISKYLKSFSPEKVIRFLGDSFEEENYVENHRQLTHKLLKRLNKAVSKDKLTSGQKNYILNLLQKNHRKLPKDFFLVHQETVFLTNRLLMSLHSPVFQKAIEWEKKTVYDYPIKDINLKIFNIITDYLATEQLPHTIGIEDLLKLMQKADELQLKKQWIEALVEKYSPPMLFENAMRIYLVACETDHKSIQQWALKYIAENIHCEEIQPVYQMAEAEKLSDLKKICLRKALQLVGNLYKKFCELKKIYPIDAEDIILQVSEKKIKMRIEPYRLFIDKLYEK